MKPGIVLAIGSILAVAGPVMAQPRAPGAAVDGDAAKAKASALIRDASRAYQAGDYAPALTKFQEAYAAFPSPRILFNLGQTYRKLARPVEATESFERFLQSAGNAPAAARTEAQSSLEEMRHEVARIEIDGGAAGSEVSVDGRVVGRLPLSRPVLVSVSAHQVVVQAQGAPPLVLKVQVIGDTIAKVQVEAPAVAAAIPAAPPASAPSPVANPIADARAPAPPAVRNEDKLVEAAPPPVSAPQAGGMAWSQKLGVGLVIAAPVLVGTGLYFGLRARDKAQDITVACAKTCTGASFLAADRDRRRLGTMQWVLVGTGSAALVGGALLYLAGGADNGDGTSRVSLAIDGDGATVGLRSPW